VGAVAGASERGAFGCGGLGAVACGAPVLIPGRVSVHRELAADGAALVGPDSAAGFARVLSSWASLGESERRRMRGHALACYERRFRRESAFRALTASLGVAA